MRASIKSFPVFYGAALLMQFAGNYFTMQSVGTWYQTLEKSALTPPGFVFGIVWTTLYILMSIAAWRVCRKEQRGYFSEPLKLWWLQLILGLLWSILFFGTRNPELALVVILLIWIVVLVTCLKFLRIEHIAAYLMTPLLAWVMFATYLNSYIAVFN